MAEPIAVAEAAARARPGAESRVEASVEAAIEASVKVGAGAAGRAPVVRRRVAQNQVLWVAPGTMRS